MDVQRRSRHAGNQPEADETGQKPISLLPGIEAAHESHCKNRASHRQTRYKALG